MKEYYVLSRKNSDGKTVYVTGHRRTSDSYSGYDVHTDPDKKKALLFGSEKGAHDKARFLSSDLETFEVEPYVSTAKVGDVVADESGERAAIKEKA
jgi:hypothetical protein